jgi:hypothetical protein
MAASLVLSRCAERGLHCDERGGHVLGEAGELDVRVGLLRDEGAVDDGEAERASRRMVLLRGSRSKDSARRSGNQKPVAIGVS